MTDPTAADRYRRWYARQKAGITWQPLTCDACGRNISGAHNTLCSRCWEKLTPEGRAAKAERVRRSRAQKKLRDVASHANSVAEAMSQFALQAGALSRLLRCRCAPRLPRAMPAGHRGPPPW